MLEVAVLVGVEFPLGQLPVDARQRVQVVVPVRGARVLNLGPLPEPDALGHGFGRVLQTVDQVGQDEIVVAARDDKIHRTGAHGLFRQGGHVVAEKNELRAPAALGLEPVHDRPVSLDHRRLGLHGDEPGLGALHAREPLVERLGPGHAVVPADVVAPGLKQTGGVGRDHGVDVGRAGEPLELSVLGQQGHALVRVQGRVGNGNLHVISFLDRCGAAACGAGPAGPTSRRASPGR